MINFKSKKEIDSDTWGYLKVVISDPIDSVTIEEINDFLNKMEEFYLEMEGDDVEL